ncbi:hypothetical protein AMJ40_02125 [candidate division TA06 bacterium DG_26]|uniref:FlgD/Vpr Ig-like domain-containing protein n=1 Tax=candidate division TA06 bacterium DG_26 TaxID=1703771 RepID=A0A0S7WKL2_UNCT6|nr:MAG: hypothetical protein AMJ40_02125 [candidate division TA06 bacterium DG_26]
MDRRFLAIVVAAFVSGSCYAFTDSLWIVGAEGNPGDLVTVEVWLEYEGGGATDSISSFDVPLTWDATVCTVETITIGADFAGFTNMSRIDNQGALGPPAVPKLSLSVFTLGWPIGPPAVPRGPHLAASIDYRILSSATAGASTCIDTLMQAFSPPVYLGFGDKNGINTYFPSFSTGCVGVPGVVWELPFDQGWNLFSFYVDLPVCSVAVVLGDFCDIVIVRGFDPRGIEHEQGGNGALTYDPSLPAPFNDLKFLYPCYGYWIKVNAACTLTVEGGPLSPESCLVLDEGWNLRCYPHETSDSVAHALTSIEGNYVIVRSFDPHGLDHCQRNNGALTFDPSLPPAFNDLVCMWPGFGYWIKMNVEDTLCYPDPLGCCGPGKTRGAEGQRGDQPSVVPTPSWVDFWGEASVDGNPVEIGDVITVYDGDGIKCGEQTVRQRGYFGVLHVYGDDETTAERDEGAEPGDELTFFINGCGADVEEGSEVRWTGDGDLSRIRLAASTVSTDGSSELVSVDSPFLDVHPNPSRGETEVHYLLAEGGEVHLQVYDSAGRLARTLLMGQQTAGLHRVLWDGTDDSGREVCPGTYFIYLETAAFSRVVKHIMLK